MSDVIVERRGAAQWLTLNRPERRNAFDVETLSQLVAGIRAAEDAAAIVITGAGRSFCAGGYLGNLAEPDPRELKTMFAAALGAFDAIRQAPQPVIAAVNGAAAGGGNELVVACDFAIAARSATLGQTGPRVGSAPVLGGTNLLAISIGEKRAKEVSMMCRRYSAEEAERLGWVNVIVEDDELEAEVDRWVQELTLLSPRYLEIAKISSNVWYNACRDTFLSGLGMLGQAAGSDDMIEGARAFMEKRAPNFRGNPS